MSLYIASDADITSVANSIRAKSGTNGTLSFPNGFITTINGIASDCNVKASEMLSGKTAFTSSGKVTGTIASLGSKTYNVSTSNQTIASGQYLSGTQTIRGVSTSNISAGNIKEGVVVTVGDSGSATRIKNVTGTCIPASLPGQTYMPFMWRNNDGQIPSFIYQKESSGSTAVQTEGYRIYWRQGQSQGNHRFRVPCNMTLTYFVSNTATSTRTVNLTSGTTYRFFQYDPNDITWAKLREDDGTDITNLFKIVSWAVS